MAPYSRIPLKCASGHVDGQGVTTVQTIATALKLFSPVFIVVAALHLIFGFGADAMLGAAISPELSGEPSLSSQNRFYGVSFAFYGVALYLCATDLPRYEPILKALLYVFFCAGAARIVAWAVDGAPAPLVIVLLATELLLPPAVLFWLRSARQEG